MTKPKPFEQSMTELETIVARLEKGELDLEEALKQFELGVQLSRTCQSQLREVEQKIEMLSIAPATDNLENTDA